MTAETKGLRLERVSGGGFALVLVVILLSLLVVLLVGLATVTRLESRVAENARDLATARRHAFLGFQRALGELQRVAGADTCATARASFSPSSDPNRSQWTGVWRAGEAAPVWLVSSPPGLAADPTAVIWRDPVTLVAGASIELVGPDAMNMDLVRVETVPLTVPAALWPGWAAADDPEIGRYAWWVGDEGTKVSVYVPDERLALAGVAGSSSWPVSDPGLLWGGVDLSTASRQDALARVNSYSQFGYVDPAFGPSRLRRNFHRTTVTAFAVPANAADGGLKEPGPIDGGDPYRPGGELEYDAVYLPETPAADATVPRGLAAARFGLRRRLGVLPPAGDLIGTAAAPHLLVAGAFNLNAVAVSPEAQRQFWRAHLPAARTLIWEDGTTRTLTDGELDALSIELTAARFRAAYGGKAAGEPFRSVNAFAGSGLLADALALTPINDGRTPASPDFVTEQQILSRLAPLLTVRSDTFVIRAYGDSRQPQTGAVLGRAWCEATVQRVADYVDPADAPDAAPARPDNIACGRRFIVTAFRWMTPADL